MLEYLNFITYFFFSLDINLVLIHYSILLRYYILIYINFIMNINYLITFLHNPFNYFTCLYIDIV